MLQKPSNSTPDPATTATVRDIKTLKALQPSSPALPRARQAITTLGAPLLLNKQPQTPSPTEVITTVELTPCGPHHHPGTLTNFPWPTPSSSGQATPPHPTSAANGVCPGQSRLPTTASTNA